MEANSTRFREELGDDHDRYHAHRIPASRQSFSSQSDVSINSSYTFVPTSQWLEAKELKNEVLERRLIHHGYEDSSFICLLTERDLLELGIYDLPQGPALARRLLNLAEEEKRNRPREVNLVNTESQGCGQVRCGVMCCAGVACSCSRRPSRSGSA
jgi:hypothetical protein